MAEQVTISQIFKELNENNSTNYKLQVLEKYKDNEILQQVLKMTYDRVVYTYGVSIATIMKRAPAPEILPVTLGFALSVLSENIATREYTGNNALQMCINLITALPEGDAEVFKLIIGRDIKCNIGRTQINKIWKNLIGRQVYMRCDVYGEKTKKNIGAKKYIQLKADGTYREFVVKNGGVHAKSRSGESYEYPIHSEEMKDFKDGVYTGELTVICNDEIIETEIQPKLDKAIKKGEPTEALEDVIRIYSEKSARGEEYILPRSLGNGMANSSNPPHAQMVFDCWDYITLEDYKLAGDFKEVKSDCADKMKAIKSSLTDELKSINPDNKVLIKIAKTTAAKTTAAQKVENTLTIIKATPKIEYKERFETLTSTLQNCETDKIRLIECHQVDTIQEALVITSKWMEQGFEGGVLKNLTGLFKDGTSSDQLKLKLEIDAEMRIIGFHDGKVGSKREGKVGSLIFGNDEGTIKGKTSGFTDKLLDDMTDNPENWLNKVMTVQFNDLSQSRGNTYYALSHPRFIEVRTDKNETDTLDTVFKLREMAMCLGAE